jgi:6-pyruvoyltetrahydropterin/6-carboxytetrahydropterin synthase
MQCDQSPIENRDDNMLHSKYKYKFYLNAAHSININGKIGERHPHTWEIAIEVTNIDEGIILFDQIEKSIEDYLNKFQDQYLNDISEFAVMNLTLENLCAFFKNSLREIIYENGMVLLSIEMSETPSRSYIINISDEIDMQNDFQFNTNKYVQDDIELFAREKISEISIKNPIS